MKTTERLTGAYEAQIEEFDDASRYIIMSDCHRGDGSVSDEFLKDKNVYLAAMDHYWKEGFTYIEGGGDGGAQLQAHCQGQLSRAGRDPLRFHRNALVPCTSSCRTRTTFGPILLMAATSTPATRQLFFTGSQFEALVLRALGYRSRSPDRPWPPGDLANDQA